MSVPYLLLGLKATRVVLVCLVLLVPQTVMASAQPHVTTLGGDDFRSHDYRSPLGQGLCLIQSIPVGPTLSQPVIIHYDHEVRPGVSTVVYHMGQTDLMAMTPDGRVLSTHRIQERESWGYITYSIQGSKPDPDRDILYVTTADPGVAAFRVAGVLQEHSDTPAEIKRFKVPHGYFNSDREWVPLETRGIVSAPLDMGGDRIVFGVVEDRIVILRGLASGRPTASVLVRRGWNSGTAIKVDDHEFVIAVAPGFVRFFLSEYEPWGQHEGRHLDFDERWSVEAGGASGLSQIALDPENIDSLYVNAKTGVFYRIDAWSGKVGSTVQQPGFINTGLAVDQENVYFGMRWLYDNGDYTVGAHIV